MEGRARHIRPLGDNILVERLTGNGIERTTKGGIVLPATLEARARTKNDVFRARVLAVGPAHDADELRRAVEAGYDHVLIYTWNDNGKKGLYTGAPADKHRLFIKPEDVVVSLMADAEVESRNSEVR